MQLLVVRCKRKIKPTQAPMLRMRSIRNLVIHEMAPPRGECLEEVVPLGKHSGGKPTEAVEDGGVDFNI